MTDGRLPIVNAKRAIRALERAGFAVERIVGSHHVLAHASFLNALAELMCEVWGPAATK